MCQRKQAKTTHLPFTLSNTSTLICTYKTLLSFRPLCYAAFPRFFLSLYLPTLLSCSLFLPVSHWKCGEGVFKLQVLVTNRSGIWFPSINTKAFPYFVTILYSGEKCSVGLQVNFNHCDTPELLNAALFISSAWQFWIEFCMND